MSALGGQLESGGADIPLRYVQVKHVPLRTQNKMEKEIPKISFSNNHSLDIEVMTFDQLSEKLNQVKSHNSFVPHKIKFFLILILTKNS
jgi:hypothetical protein